MYKFAPGGQFSDSCYPGSFEHPFLSHPLKPPTRNLLTAKNVVSITSSVLVCNAATYCSPVFVSVVNLFCSE